VLDSGNAWFPVDREALIRSAIGDWRDSLIAPASRLLSFRPGSPGTIRVVRPPAAAVLARLLAGGTFTFRASGEAPAGLPPEPGILDTDKDPGELGAELRALMRRSDQEYTDRGLPLLHLAFGTLTWAGEDLARRASPVLLVPARLVAAGAGELPVLAPAGEDPVVNPALARLLARQGITLPQPGELPELTLAGLLAAVWDAVGARDPAGAREGWQLSESAVLSCFPLGNEAIYRDLLEHEDLIAAHPAVGALAAGVPAGQDRGPGFAAIAADDIDQRAAPEATPVVLDADASQRACIAAALAGRSFVIDGPPGTGKSQTIANMIGGLLHAGKTVLFVSEKAAALDAVADRLTGAGLDDYLLGLHSGAARRQVAAGLRAALDSGPAVPAPMPRADRETARQRREQLTACAEAMNRVRDPLGYSLRDVLDLIAARPAEPAMPALGLAPAGLTGATLAEIRQAAADLAAAWRPAAQGRAFRWRGVTARGPLDDVLYQAASALETLTGVAGLNQALSEVTGLYRPSDAAALADLLDHLWHWPESMPDEWLTTDTLEAVEAAVVQLTAAMVAVRARENQAAEAAGLAWVDIPPPAGLPVVDTRPLAGLAPPPVDPGNLTAGQIAGLAQALADDAAMLERCLASLAGLAGAFAMRVPETFGEAIDLLTLALLAREPDRPERSWLSAAGHQAASQAGGVLYDAHSALAAVEAEATAYFTADALYEDLDGLLERFEDGHRAFGVLSGEYRADKKTIAAITREGVSRDEAQERLGIAAAWKHAVEAVAAAEARYAAVLGPYYSGRTTNFGRLGRALSHAATAVRCARRQDLSRAAGYISREGARNLELTAMAAETMQELAAWRGNLAPAPAIAPRPELLNGPIRAAIGWLRVHLAPLHAACQLTGQLSEATGRQLTFAEARQVLALREAAETAHAQLRLRDSVFQSFCGPLYAGMDSDLNAMRAVLEWARRLRLLITGGSGPLTPAQLRAAENAVATPGLAEAAAAWQAAAGKLMAAFSPARRRELAAELDDYEGGAALIEAMFDDASGRAEWLAHQAARAVLAGHGLDLVVDTCITERIPPAQLPDLVERAVLREWADHQLKTDPALAAVAAAGPGELAREYAEFDRALVAAAAGDIIRACNARRPDGDTAQAALIRREAARDSGHLPVRALLEQTSSLTQAVKPCFLATPAAVSQYLPASLHFDVVIVDEASQVSPAAAISCAYRGTALILCGDQQQLPPASSAQVAGWAGGATAEPADPYDPTSILDLAKGSGAFRALSLRVHYRSRHEALISFADTAFYGGRLLTFPAPRRPGPDAGVELLRGEGTCRGPARDNPREAARVAQRVIHHFDTRPGLSLGVVTFSDAQAAAIEAAVRRARQGRPDLDRFFAGGRRDGFFIKDAGAAQGDERDVIIVSLGYGPDDTGAITADFGPLSRPGGWRWLNVATTRARQRTEVVSSLDAEDVPDAGEGLRFLRHYLDYAARGLCALPASATACELPSSPLAESVGQVLRTWGYEFTPQAGATGYRVGIGVHHPDSPGSFALGIEFDDGRYYAARAARDRDRLREQVLRGLGWRLHRVWAIAWYRDRAGEERRLRSAIERALAAPGGPAVAGSRAAGGQAAGGQAVDSQAAGGQAARGGLAAPNELAARGGQAEPGQVVPGRAVQGQAVPGEAVPGQVVPGQAMPGQAVPGQAVPGQAVPGRAAPGEQAARGRQAAAAGEGPAAAPPERAPDRPVADRPAVPGRAAAAHVPGLLRGVSVPAGETAEAGAL
jgi:REase_MTES_1575/Protein of unknown function (DUF4011)/AAA domain